MPFVHALLTFFLLVGGVVVPLFAAEKSMQTATFAGGCFWCMVKPFDQYEGVEKVVVGYTGGTAANPTYKEVCDGKTGHVEAVQMSFDEKKISYEQLLTIFWRQIDPTDDGGQFADRGTSYRTAIFYHDAEQKTAAEKSREALQKEKRFDKPIRTEILPAGDFYPAEEHHQNYYIKNPLPYAKYFAGSGRKNFLATQWKSRQPGSEELQKRLTPLQFAVTQHDKTEPAFCNEYWNNDADGIYVDVVDGRPLFSSKDKFDAGCGWPSFSKPIDLLAIVKKSDTSLKMQRTEVRSFSADSHLGHVFSDGPATLGGLRYCINSASLRFVPKEKMREEGYADWLPLFKNDE